MELRSGAFVTIEDTEISNSGQPGIQSHLGARGFILKNSTLYSNCVQVQAACSVMCSGGTGDITDSQISELKGNGGLYR